MPKISESELNKQIKNKAFSNMYLIYGNEKMFVSSYTKKLLDAVAGKDKNDFNFHEFSSEINFDDFAAAVQMVPFAAENNCVYLYDIAFDEMDKDSIDRLYEICSLGVQSTVIIFSMPSYVPKKNARLFSSFVKKCDKIASVCNFEKQNHQMLEKFVAKWANEYGKIISHINAEKIINLVGEDLNLLKNETYKICSYSDGEQVTDEDIEKLATVNLEAKIFSLADDVLNGYGDRAFNTLDKLFYQQEEPIKMLFVLSGAYIDAYRIRVADECAISKTQVATEFEYKNRAFVLDNSRRATARVSTDALRKSLDLLVDADIKFKSTSVNKRILMEQLIAKLLLISKEGRR